MPPSVSGKTTATSRTCSGNRKVTVSPEILAKWDLPEDYCRKWCQFCGGDSLDPSPYPCSHPDHEGWGGLEPWGGGTKNKPSGLAHRLCLNIWHDGGFCAKYKNQEAYHKACQQDPTLNAEFMSSKRKLIAMKIANPSLRIRNKESLMPQRFLRVTRGRS